MAKQKRSGSGNPSGPPFIDRGEPLPQSYAENRIVGLVRDPELIFMYWDIDSDVRVAGHPLLIRVHNLSEGVSYDFDPGRGAQGWYLQVTPNRCYRLELHARSSDGSVRLIASSGELVTPVRWAGESGREPPAEAIFAERYPMTRRQRPSRRRAARVPLHRAVRSPAPVLVEAPTVAVFGAAYTRGTGK